MKRMIWEAIGVKVTILGLISLAGVITAYFAGLRKVNEAVLQRVDTEFKTERIQTVVAHAAATQGTNLLEKAVRPEIEKFKEELKESVVRLEAQTSNAIAKLDPKHQPVRHIFGSAHIVARGRVLPRGGLKVSATSLQLGRRTQAPTNLWMVFLNASKMDHGSNESETHFFFEFTLDSMMGLSNAKNMTVGQIDELDVLRMFAMFLPDKVEVLHGSATVTFNSAYQKEYPIPAQSFPTQDIPLPPIIISVIEKK